MFTKHLLVVGTSLTDDNFLRLAYEVTNYLSPSGKDAHRAEPLGTVLNLAPEPAKRSLWQGTFHVLAASDDKPRDVEGSPQRGEPSGPTANEQARNLSIVLDFIAMHAAKENFLLDGRYSALLDDGEDEIATMARTLHHRLVDLPQVKDEQSGWRRLIEALVELGSRPDERGHRPRYSTRGRRG